MTIIVDSWELLLIILKYKYFNDYHNTYKTKCHALGNRICKVAYDISVICRRTTSRHVFTQ